MRARPQHGEPDEASQKLPPAKPKVRMDRQLQILSKSMDVLSALRSSPTFCLVGCHSYHHHHHHDYDYDYESWVMGIVDVKSSNIAAKGRRRSSSNGAASTAGGAGSGFASSASSHRQGT